MTSEQEDTKETTLAEESGNDIIEVTCPAKLLDVVQKVSFFNVYFN